jgi:hypothetical protein
LRGAPVPAAMLRASISVGLPSRRAPS